ncbi:hypothetical protein BMS3Bbin11_00516 [bacterium BMS3Bbin11]|nr:hypothetical protein BMS3Bbin11_00516 [bacterium BMS3Bbin11]
MHKFNASTLLNFKFFLYSVLKYNREELVCIKRDKILTEIKPNIFYENFK